MTLEDLQVHFSTTSPSVDSYRARQIYDWIWKKGTTSFDEMTNLSKELRDFLKTNFSLNHITINNSQYSADGTIKNAIKLYDDNLIESVLIPTKKRITACISSQVGCSLDCIFCATSRLKRIRNLNYDEIFDQIVFINKQSLTHFNRPLTNIVYMGMGEPLMNYTNVLASIQKITSKDGLNISQRRITLSTSGIPKLIKKLADTTPKFKLAVSLHSAIEKTRNEIMPFSKAFPLTDLLESLQYWYQETKSIITFEYIVWKDINDKQTDINALISFCRKVPSKVNLITYNSIGSKAFIKADNTVVEKYISTLETANVTVKIRHSRGQDIAAACGQLANKA